ncbi:hypothetical protein Esti_001459 [Eimeria stiedai]
MKRFQSKIDSRCGVFESDLSPPQQKSSPTAAPAKLTQGGFPRMTTYIVEGRCDCARLARCQLLADRVFVILPSVRIQTEIFEPDEYKERLASHACSFPNFHITQKSQGPVVYTAEGLFIGDDESLLHLLSEKYKIAEEEPDLEGEALQAVLKRLVEANIRSLRKQKQLRLEGPPIIEEAEARTLAIIEEHSRASRFPRESRSSSDPEDSWRPGFNVVPDIRVERIIEGGSRFAFWSSSHLRKKGETNRRLQLQSEEISLHFLLNSTLPRGAPISSCHFRLVLHDEPLCRNHLVLVPRDCMRQQHSASAIKKIFIALVVAPKWDGFLPQLAKKCRGKLKVSWIFKDLPEDDGDEVYRLQPEEYANELPSLLKNATHNCVILAGAPSSVVYCFLSNDNEQESVALDNAETSPDVCVIVGDTSSFPKKRREAVENLACRTYQLGLSLKETDLSKVADFLQEKVELFIEKKTKAGKVRVTRRACKRSSPSLEGFDWVAATEVLENISGLVTFQLFPSSYRDHRRPLDTHMEVFPFPIPPVGKHSLFQNFPFEHFVQNALQRNAVFIPELPFVHALIRILPEKPLAACLERMPSEDKEEEAGVATSFKQAYHQAIQILRESPNVSLDLSTSAQSLLLGPSFLLLIPHPNTELGVNQFPVGTCVEGCSAGDLLWADWPPPPPFAFAGGAAGFPNLRRAWMDAEDPRRSHLIAFKPLEVGINDSQKGGLAINDDIWKRPMHLLSASCCPWKRPSSHEDEEQQQPAAV